MACKVVSVTSAYNKLHRTSALQALRRSLHAAQWIEYPATLACQGKRIFLQCEMITARLSFQVANGRNPRRL